MLIYQWVIEEKNKPIIKDLSRFAFRTYEDALENMMAYYADQYLYNVEDRKNGTYLFYHTSKRLGYVGYIFSSELI